MTILEIFGRVLVIMFDGFNIMWEEMFRIPLPSTIDGRSIYIFSNLGEMVLFIIYALLFVHYLFRLVKGVGGDD